MSLCQKCRKRPASHRVRMMVDEDRAMTPSPEEFRGPVWSMDAVTCAPCAAEVGMLLAAQVLDQESN